MRWIRIGAALMFLAVSLGAFGAHGLKESLTPESLEIFQTGVHYQFIHALGLILLGAVQPRLRPRRVRVAGIAFLLGIGIFSGSLYLIALTGMSWLGAITPLGGLSFLVGWLLLALGRPRPTVEPLAQTPPPAATRADISSPASEMRQSVSRRAD